MQEKSAVVRARIDPVILEKATLNLENAGITVAEYLRLTLALAAANKSLPLEFPPLKNARAYLDVL